MHIVQLKKLVWKDFNSVIPATWLPEKMQNLEVSNKDYWLPRMQGEG